MPPMFSTAWSISNDYSALCLGAPDNVAYSRNANGLSLRCAYKMRWDIEVFFKCTKSLLRLQKEFQGRSYDLLISHTTIVFSRYILLACRTVRAPTSAHLGVCYINFVTK